MEKSKRNFRVQLVSTVSLLMGAGMAASAVAQDVPPPPSDGDGLVVVVVTAQKRAEKLQSTPIAVTALTAKALADQNITTLADLSHAAPNLAISASGYTAPTNALPVVYIRGIGQQDPSIYSDPGVPVYVDGVYVSRSAGGAIDLPDIARVEVLRGPQGTLFGKNAVGGAINVITATPGKSPGTELWVTGGSYNLAEFRGVTNLALSDQLAVTGAIDFRKEDGFGRRLSSTGATLGRLGDQSHQSGRVKARWAPTEDLTIDLAADYTRYRDTATPGQGQVLAAPLANLWNAQVGSHNGTPFTQAGAASGDYDNYSANPQPVQDTLAGISGTVSYDFGGMTLKSITAFREGHDVFSRDADSSAAVYLEANRDMHSQQYSQEVQLLGKLFDDKLEYFFGGYYLFDKSHQFDRAFVLPGLAAATHNNVQDRSRSWDDRQNTTSKAIFAQFTYHFSPEVSLTAGLRSTEEKKDASVYVISPETAIVYVPTTNLSKRWSAATPRLAINYQATKDLLLYASASKGFKSGGFNGRPNNVASLTTFNPETVWSYEVGEKSEWFNHKLRVNAALFRSDYSNIQLSRQILDPVTSQVISDVSNVAAARINGAEGEIAIVPVRHLEFNFSAGYTHNEYTRVQPGAAVAINSKIPYSPARTWTASVRYTFDLHDAGKLDASANYAYRSSTYVTPINTAVSLLPAYGVLGARLVYTPATGPWDVTLYGTNLQDKRYLTSIGDSAGVGLVYKVYGRPREVGLTLGLHF